jgi:hypothetical protein
MEREELRLARKAHLLEHGTDGPSETLKRLLRFPDIDYPKAVLGRTSGVGKNSTG